jgi:hypothetical protein
MPSVSPIFPAPVVLQTDHDISPLLLNKLVLELEVGVQLLEFIQGHLASVCRRQADPLD